MDTNDSPLDEKTKIALVASQELRMLILKEALNLCIKLPARNSLRIVFDEYDEALIERWRQSQEIKQSVALHFDWKS